MEETGYILYRKGMEEARLSVFAAIDLGDEGISSEKHGFLVELVKKSILVFAEGEKEREKDRMLIVP